MSLTTNKPGIQHLAALCHLHGIEYVVLSPGSRCAPLVIAFNRQQGIQCLSIIDERSAGFVALGIAQQQQKPVALVCTSGSAVLNYGPAIAEAFYQRVPLVVFTADRPNEWIDQGENQSINQYRIYQNFIKKSVQLPVEAPSDADLWFSDRLISEAINCSITGNMGPVHVNVPLREPLYGLAPNNTAHVKKISPSDPVTNYAVSDVLTSKWKSAKRKMVIVGQMHADEKFEKALEDLSKQTDTVVLTEATSNIPSGKYINRIDPNIDTITHNQLAKFTPDLVVTLGGAVVSKKLKFWLRNAEDLEHWHVDSDQQHRDTFQHLQQVIAATPSAFCNAFSREGDGSSDSYTKLWSELDKKTRKVGADFMEQCPWSDLSVFKNLLENLPPNTCLQLGNSTPIRYANLFDLPNQERITIYGNRGISGIDGQISTAVGASIATKDQMTVCITGDLGFFYDSNGLWNNYLDQNLRVIVINNGGGNIFRIIPGPDTVEELDTFFETQHNRNAELIAKSFGLEYQVANNDEELKDATAWIYDSNVEQPRLLEIFTPNDISAETIRSYLSYIKENYEQ